MSKVWLVLADPFTEIESEMAKSVAGFLGLEDLSAWLSPRHDSH